MTVSNWLTVVSIAVALISVSYTIWDKLKAQRRRLVWRVPTNTSLTSDVSAEQGLDKLAIHWDGVEVKMPRLVRIEIENSGRVELKSNDTSLNPRIDFKESKIISAQLKLKPAGANVSSVVQPTAQTDNSLEASAVALNRRDQLIFTLLLDGEEESIQPLMQAAGFTFREQDGDDHKRWVYVGLGASAALLIALLLLLSPLGLLIAKEVAINAGAQILQNLFQGT